MRVPAAGVFLADVMMHDTYLAFPEGSLVSYGLTSSVRARRTLDPFCTPSERWIVWEYVAKLSLAQVIVGGGDRESHR
jgi:hypothetical protein